MGTFAGNREGKDMAKLVLSALAACKGVGGGGGGGAWYSHCFYDHSLVKVWGVKMDL